MNYKSSSDFYWWNNQQIKDVFKNTIQAHIGFIWSVVIVLIGTESETKAFMAVCIETAKRYNLDDYRTPVFIFERLCSIIYPVSYLDTCI